MRLRTTLTTVTAIFLLCAGCGPVDENDDTNDDGNKQQQQQNVTCDGSTCTVSGEITDDLTIPNDDKTYILSGPVFVGDGESE